MKLCVASSKLTKTVWRNTFVTASSKVLRALANYRSREVQGAKGRLGRTQEHEECSGLQELHPAGICRNRDMAGRGETLQMSNDLKLKVLKGNRGNKQRGGEMWPHRAFYGHK